MFTPLHTEMQKMHIGIMRLQFEVAFGACVRVSITR